MKLVPDLTDEAILEELGRRLARRRIELELTQAELARVAGIGKRTLERIEAGGSSQMSSLIRVLRALGLIVRLEQLLPEGGPRPMELLEARRSERRRASPKRRARSATPTAWVWGDES